MGRSPVGVDSRNLDFLRAIAVLCVFLAHLSLFLIKLDYVAVSAANKVIWKIILDYVGHTGVLFFFVHTALVLMLSLDRSDRMGMVIHFYIRRIFRIYPLCIVCICAVLLLEVPQVPEATFVPWDKGEIIANLFLVQNIFSLPDMIMPLWTLPREFQMYLVLPFIYLLLKRFSSTLTVLLLWFGFLAVAPHAQLLASFPCFMGGVVAYQLAKEKVFRLPAAVWPFAILGLSVFGVLLNMTVMPDFRADFIVCMLLGLVIPNVLDLKASWITRASKTVAEYSYGIYLCHEPVIWLAFVKLKAYPVPLRWATLVVLMVGVPWLAQRWIEAPLIAVGRRIAVRWTAAYVQFRASRNPLLQPLA